MYILLWNGLQTNKTNFVASVYERNILTERLLLVKEISANFWDRWCRVISATHTYGCILDFLDRCPSCFFQVNKHTNYVALVRERSILIERLLLVGDVNANF
jgi:hypothetical protein